MTTCALRATAILSLGFNLNTQQDFSLRAVGLRACLENEDEFTFFNSKAVAPLLQGDVLIFVGVALLKEASYAVFHGHQRCPQRSKLGMCQDSAMKSMAAC